MEKTYEIKVKQVAFWNNIHEEEIYTEKVVTNSSTTDFQKYYQQKSKLYACQLTPLNIKIIN